jgi:hypothetical protein
MNTLIIILVVIGVTSFVWWVIKRGVAGAKSDIQDIGSDAKKVEAQAQTTATQVKTAVTDVTNAVKGQ